MDNRRIKREYLVGESDTTAVVDFRFQNQYLSNFYPAEVEFEGLRFPSSEHAYQAAKTLDPELRETIRTCGSAAVSKRIGAKIDIRPHWEQIKFSVMFEIVSDKFERNGELRAKLQATGYAKLIEGNWWHDTFWGRCTCEKHKGEGLNNLGEILMGIRGE